MSDEKLCDERKEKRVVWPDSYKVYPLSIPNISRPPSTMRLSLSANNLKELDDGLSRDSIGSTPRLGTRPLKIIHPPVTFTRGLASPSSACSLNNPNVTLSQPSQLYPAGSGDMRAHHRGELSMADKYTYDLSKAQLKASSRTSALLAGFAMVALVELQYEETTPHFLLIILGVVTTLLVSVHLLALMMSTCILPYMEAAGATQDSPHKTLKFYIDLSWLFSTCIGLLLFLVEIGVIFFVKFNNVGYDTAAYITTAMLVPVVVVFIIFSYLIHRNRTTHSLMRIKDKVAGLNDYFDAERNMNSARPVHQI